MKKTFKLLLSLTLIVVMCVSLCAAAFADDAAPVTSLTISKDLIIAENTTVPTASFVYTLTADTSNSIGLQTDETCPSIDSVSVSYASTDSSDNGVVTKTVTVDFTDVTFPHAGVYAYTLSEDSANSYQAATGEEITYDDTVYTVYVYVINGDSGLEIAGVKITDDDGQKVDPDDGSLFENTYTKNAGTLTISKEVSGDYADETKEFSYTLTITAAATAEEDEAFTCKLDGTDTDSGVCGTAYTFSLTHGQSLEISGLTAGATYTLTETGEEDYLPSADVVTNSGTPVSFGSDADYGDYLDTEGGIGEKVNSASFTNSYNDGDITPTGIIINILPFVMLIAVAAVGMILFVIFTRRKAKEN